MSLENRPGNDVPPSKPMEPAPRLHLDETPWFAEVQRFLELNPESSLLALVREVSPDFLTVGPDARAHLWFWMKNELRLLTRAGAFRSEIGLDGITTYSLPPNARETPGRPCDAAEWPDM